MSCQPCQERQQRLLAFAAPRGWILAAALALALLIVWAPKLNKEHTA